MNLHGEFTCGQKDQGANVLGGSVFRRLSVGRFRAQHLDDRNQERESLAGAGLGGADYVLALKGRRNGSRLGGGERKELSCRQLLLKGSRQGQFGKCCHSIVFFLEGPSRFSNTLVESSHAARIKIGAGTKRRAGNAEVGGIQRDPRLTANRSKSVNSSIADVGGVCGYVGHILDKHC